MNFIAEKLRIYRTEVFLAITALLLYMPAMGWGLPHATGPELTHPWGPDDIAPLGPLAEFHNTFINAKVDRFLAYPLMHYGIVGLAYAPYVVYLLATGGLSNAMSTFPYGLADPVHSLRVLSLIARSITLLMAIGTVVAAYKAAQSLWDHTRGLLAGIFVMLLYPMFYYSRTGNLDVPALFWAALGLVVYVRILRDDFTVSRGIWLGVFAAMSAGTKDQGAGLFVLLPLVLIPLHFSRMAQKETDVRAPNRWRAPAATVTVGLLVYMISSGFIFRPERYFAHIAWISGMRPDSPVHFGYEATVRGYAALVHESIWQLAGLMSGPLLVIAMFGILIAVLHDRLALAFLIPVIGLFSTVIVPTRHVEMRYLIPVGFILVCFAAYVLGGGMLSKRRLIRAASVVVVLGICTLPMLRGIDLTHAMLYDSRYAASDWLNARLHSEDQIEFFGPHQKLPRLKAKVKLTRAVEFFGTDRTVRYTKTEIQAMAEGITNRRPDFILVIPDHSSSARYPYGTTCPQELYSLLRDGSLGYRLTAEFETPPLFNGIGRPPLDYPAVNPPVHIFARITRSGGGVARI